MSSYRGSRDRYSRKSGYSSKDLYRRLREYRRPYRSPRYPRQVYSGKRGRNSNLSRYLPRQQINRSPEPKYKSMSRERISSPMRREPLRYTEKHSFRPDRNGEQMIKDAEGKLNRDLIEKLEAEINKLRSEINNERAKTQVQGSIEPQETLEQDGDDSKQTETIQAEETKEKSERTSEAETETPEEADHLEAYILDEGWIDEDGLNPLSSFVESNPESVDLESENSENIVETENEKGTVEQETESEENEPVEKTEEDVETMDSENEELLGDMYLEDEAEVLREMEIDENLEVEPSEDRIREEVSAEVPETADKIESEPMQDEIEPVDISEPKDGIEQLESETLSPLEVELYPELVEPIEAEEQAEAEGY